MGAFDNKYPYTDWHELNLDWFLAEFKKVTDKVTTLDATVQQFTDFVTNYFDNLDLQEEVNKKLNEMVEDGTIGNMIQTLFNDFEDQINNTVTIQNVLIDNQNTRIGALSARMDQFASLEEGSTTGDAELMDGRVGANGVTYPSIGDAIRGQYDELNDKIEDINDTYIVRTSDNLLNPDCFRNDTAVQWNTGEETVNSNYVSWVKIPVIAGKTLYFSRGNLTPQGVTACCTYDEDETYTGNISSLPSVIPSGTKYVSISITKTAYQNFSTWMMQYDQITYYTPYFENYQYTKPERIFVESFCHQGYKKEAPNQTMAAYKAARDYGFLNIECDINVTSDNELICCHNDTVYADPINMVINQTLQAADATYTDAIVISQTTLATLQSYSWGAWKDASYSAETVLKFDDLIAFAKINGLQVFVDDLYRVANDDTLFQKYANIIDKYGMHKYVISSSVGARLGNWHDDVIVAYGLTSYDAHALDQPKAFKQNHPEATVWIAMSYLLLNETRSTEIHENGFKLLVYTVNNMSDMYNYSSLVDAITTDEYIMEDVMKLYNS